MTGTSVEKLVNAPVERVFELATDLRRAPETIRGILEMEVLTEGPVGKGTRFRETRKMFGREHTKVTMRFEATPVTLMAKMISPMMRSMMKSVEKLCSQDLDDIKAKAEA